MFSAVEYTEIQLQSVHLHSMSCQCIARSARGAPSRRGHI